MQTTPDTKLRVKLRIIRGNENHHIWNNNGTWWLNFTLRAQNGTARRIRKSLKTADVEKAKASRDRVLLALLRSTGNIAA